MKWLRPLKNRFGVHTGRMAVRLHVPWYWRWAGLAAACTVVAGVVGWTLNTRHQETLGLRGALEEKIETLTDLNQALEAQNRKLEAEMAALHRQQTIDKAAQSELTRSLAKSQEEILRLKEDLQFFQSAVPGAAQVAGLSIQNFKVEADPTPNRFHYRLLLMQKGLRDRDFRGRGEINVSADRNGRRVIIKLSEASPLELKFKYYQQIEGSFDVTAGMVVREVEFLVYEQGQSQPKIKETVSVS